MKTIMFPDENNATTQLVAREGIPPLQNNGTHENENISNK